ncbi:hypothetical protein D3C76_1456010 [compost metagenome]
MAGAILFSAPFKSGLPSNTAIWGDFQNTVRLRIPPEMIMPNDSIFRSCHPCPGFFAVIIAKAVGSPPKSIITKPYNE